jgi:hypothetical protein
VLSSRQCVLLLSIFVTLAWNSSSVACDGICTEDTSSKPEIALRLSSLQLFGGQYSWEDCCADDLEIEVPEDLIKFWKVSRFSWSRSVINGLRCCPFVILEFAAECTFRYNRSVMFRRDRGQRATDDLL